MPIESRPPLNPPFPSVHARPPGETTAPIDLQEEEDSAAIRTRQRLLGREFPGVREYERGAPAFDRYPITRHRTIARDGINGSEQIGFTARSIMAANPTPHYLYLSDFGTWVPPFSRSAFNVVGSSEVFNWEWRWDAFDMSPVIALNQYAILDLHDEWLPPFSEPLMPPIQTAFLNTTLNVAGPAGAVAFYTPPSGRAWAFAFWDGIFAASDFLNFGHSIPGVAFYSTGRTFQADGPYRRESEVMPGPILPRTLTPGQPLTVWSGGGLAGDTNLTVGVYVL